MPTPEPLPPTATEAAAPGRLRTSWLALAAFWLACFGYLTAAIFKGRYDGDEFIFTMDAARVAAGEVQARDFFQYIMPGWLLLTGLVYKIVGPSLLAARLLLAALIAAMATIYWRLGRALGAGRLVALLAALVPVVVYNGTQFYFGHRWFAQTMTAVALLFAWRALNRTDDRAWAWAGLGVGLTHCMHQQDGAVLFAGLGLGALWLAWYERWPLAQTAKRAGFFLLGWAAPLALLALYYLAHGTLGQLLYDTHVWTVTQYRSPGNHNDVDYATDLGPLIGPAPWISRPFFYGRLLTTLVTDLLPALVALGGLAWLFGLGRRGGLDARGRFAGLLACVCVFGLLAAMRARADVAHLAGGMMPFMLLAVAAIAAYERTVTGALVGGLRWLPRLGLAAFVGAGALTTFELARHDPALRPSFTSPDARIQAHPTFAALRRHLQPGDTILVGGHGAIYNFYLAPNPTRFDYWLPPEQGFTNQAQFQEVMADVRAKKPRLVLMIAGRRETADANAQALLGMYEFVESLPHSQSGWNVELRVWVYKLKPDQGAVATPREHACASPSSARG